MNSSDTWGIPILKNQQRSLQLVVLVAIIVIAAFFRLYHIVKMSSFTGDQGQDFTVSQLILDKRQFPLIGPPLTVDGAHTPPTYYYLLAALLKIGGTPEAAITIFGVLNVFLFFLLYRMGTYLIDGLFGLIVAGVFAVSWIMIEYAQTIWQPNMVMPLLLVSLFFLVKGEKSNSFSAVVLSVAVYVLALSVYPSPVILFPFFLVHTFVCLKQILRNKTAETVLTFVLLWGACILIVSMPLIVFELRHRFPVRTIIVSDSFGLPGSVREALQIYATYIVGIFFLVFQWTFHAISATSAWSQRIGTILILLFAGAVIGVRYLENQLSIRIRHKAASFSSLFLSPWLIFGFLPLVLYQDRIYTYRTSTIVPFILFILAFIIWFSFRTDKLWFKSAAWILAGVYIYANVFLIDQFVFLRPLWEVPNIRYFTGTIAEDMKQRDIPVDDMNLFVYSPSDVHNFEAMRYVYFLYRDIGYPVRLNTDGNDLVRSMNTSKAYIYLGCADFPDYTAAQTGCVTAFRDKHKEYEVLSKQAFRPDMLLYLLHKQSSMSDAL